MINISEFEEELNKGFLWQEKSDDFVKGAIAGLLDLAQMFNVYTSVPDDITFDKEHMKMIWESIIEKAALLASCKLGKNLN